MTPVHSNTLETENYARLRQPSLSAIAPQFLRRNTRQSRKAMINSRRSALGGSLYYITSQLRAVDFQTERLPRCFQLAVFTVQQKQSTSVAVFTVLQKQSTSVAAFCSAPLLGGVNITSEAVAAFCWKPVRGRSNWFQRAGRLGSRSNCQAAPPSTGLTQILVGVGYTKNCLNCMF